MSEELKWLSDIRETIKKRDQERQQALLASAVPQCKCGKVHPCCNGKK